MPHDRAFLDAECGAFGLCTDSDFNRHVFDAGVYHTPVDQLTMGLEVNYLIQDAFVFPGPAVFGHTRDDEIDNLTVAFITWFNL